WEHGSGPCGPCSEIYYDRGEKYGCGKPTCTVGCDCDRYIEVWNNVFSQFNNDGHGNYTELIQKNIDTGMGLERLAVVVQDVDSIFDVDTLAALTAHVGEITGVRYKSDPKKDVSIRIITDHIRSVTFMISDGIMPSNVGRGYVLRRLLRRAARHGRLLGTEGTFLAGLAETVIETSKDGYPELEEKKSMILSVIREEENKFNKTIDSGLSILNEAIEALEKQGAKVLPGDQAFKLYDTYGFPKDLTEEILEEKGMTMDAEGFDAAMANQKRTAKNARKTSNYMGKEASVFDEIDASLTTEFCGYQDLTADSEILVLVSRDEEGKEYGDLVDTLEEGETGVILTEKTPFYATMGGQESDFGRISNDHGLFRVKKAVHLQGGKIAHLGVVESGSFSVRDGVTLSVDRVNREFTAENHSATHLLQKALRDVLGSHVEQAGSYNDANRLRFDFTHFQAISAEDLKKVEDEVRQAIADALPVVTREMTLDEAKKEGAMALFGEKYGERVRVVSMGDFSIELCGGTHVKNTRDIGPFKILSESGIAAGVRRIEAITGERVLRYYEDVENRLKKAAEVVKASPDRLTERLGSLVEELKKTQSENEKLKAELANQSAAALVNKAVDLQGIRVLITEVPDADMNELRTLGDSLRDKLGESAVLLVSAKGVKVSLSATATDQAVSKGVHAGNLIREIAKLVGGGGGGRPNSAQAGGKDPSGIPAVLETAMEVLKKQIKES
ncbi:MAG: alanine--tRNA ligase, partial [Lachnospiraceae bacterium]|nr:alanine--tRNA ligase [Lachnospiraceae bacterium]